MSSIVFNVFGIYILAPVAELEIAEVEQQTTNSSAVVEYTEMRSENTVEVYVFSINSSPRMNINRTQRSGEVVFNGLDAGTLYLVEVRAQVTDPRTDQPVTSPPLTEYVLTREYIVHLNIHLNAVCIKYIPQCCFFRTRRHRCGDIKLRLPGQNDSR